MNYPFKDKTPQVDPSAFVADNASLVGDVTVGKDSSVWFGAVLRGDNGPIAIGEGSNVQDNATLHCHPGDPLRVGNNVTIGHNAIVHCLEVGDDTLVGMGSILMNGVKVGKHCIIGAGAVVTERTVVPDGTMMLGVPAKPVKTLSPEAVEALEQQSFYVDLAKAYMK